MIVPRNSCLRASGDSTERGFTLIELMVGLVLLAAVAWGLTTILIHSSQNRTSTMNRLESTQSASAALNMIAGDVRSAGYGADADEVTPQPAIAYVDQQELIISENLQPYPDNPTTHQPPQAYDPNGNPRPKPLDGTTWQPPMKYRYGAELVRYTLDLNNDGTVDAGDLATTDGADARRTRNPNDYVLVRQVYGDSVGNISGNNGGTTERIAIVSKPGGTIPPLYTVYMRGQSTPYDWANGPVPAAQLPDIERVEVRVNSPSSRPDWRGQYANTELKTIVSSMRNSPLVGPPTYVVDGYIYNDLNKNDIKDAGEVGIPSANVRLGNIYTCYTASNGYFFMRAPAGTYTLRHTPPSGYGVWSNPDSFVVNLTNAAVHHNFADTARAGGWVNVLAYNDANGNAIQDGGEGPLSGIQMAITPGTDVVFTDASGAAQLFAPVGGFSVAATPPDSLVSTTPNPVSGTMTNGGTASVVFGFKTSLIGTIKGKVFRDNNRNGIFDGTDSGIQNVYVGVTPDNGLTMLGYAYTDANGDYSIVVPINDPPHTRPYMVFIVPPAGFFPTTSTAIPNQWVQSAAILTGKNFGVGSYQIITLNASRVLCLASADLIEKDWNGNQTQNAVKDKDLVLGADAGGTDNVSVWFNNYNSTPLFSATPTYARTAPNSVMALAVDTLDMASPIARPDVVTGTKIAANGNLFVWLNQNSSGNLGFLPNSPGLAYRTSDGGDVQAVLTRDVAGGNMPDIVAGTKSLTAGRGTIEVWQNSDAASPTFTQQEVYPNAGSIPGNRMGEVTVMAWADMNGDGSQDLIVGTKTGLYTGELLVFQLRSKNNGNRFICQQDISITDGQVTSLACADVDRDGQVDIIVGVQESNATGSLRYYHNKNNLVSFGLDMIREVPTPGIPTALSAADLGGGAGSDIAMGWRQTDTGYAGGVLIYYTDLLNLPFSGVDPSAGTIRNFIPALAADDFNYGVQPSTPSPPYLTDLACGVKSSPTTGALVVFIR
jgi:prepilin-type N-terminal cleavage/methylation domain-containing protein